MNFQPKRSWPQVAVVIFSLLLFALLSVTIDAADSSGPGITKPDPNANAGDPPPERRLFSPGQVVVRFADGFTPTSPLGEMLDTSIAGQSGASEAYLLQFDEDSDVDSIVGSLEGVQGVEYVHPNYLVDQLDPVQGSYPFEDELGTGDYSNQRAVSDLDLSDAHQLATGAGVKVAVIDCGVDFSHPAFSNGGVSRFDFVSEDYDAFDEPGGTISGHGTFVAGIIHLVAPDAELQAYRVIDSDGQGDGFTLARAIEMAVADGCNVINLSLVLTGQHLAVRDAIALADANGVLVIAAAGNDATGNPVYPAAEAATIAVAAVDSIGMLAEFSNFGDYIDVCAPGINIYSSFRGSNFAWWSGTSFSTPFVSGLSALLLDQGPIGDASQMRTIISSTAVDLDDLNPDHAGLLGTGIINPVTALNQLGTAAFAAVYPDTLYFVHDSGNVNVTMPFGNAFVTSTNAPAFYTATVFESYGPLGAFTYLTDSTGYTNDTLVVQVAPYDLPIGTHYNSVLISVDGVTDPIELTICLTVNPPSEVEPIAEVIPNMLYFTAAENTEPIIFGSAMLTSSDGPSPFIGQVLSGGSQFTTLLDTSGTTNTDSVHIAVDPSLAGGPGFFYDSVSFSVDGITNPALLVISLQITADTTGDTTGGGGQDSAWVMPSNIYAQAVQGSTTQQIFSPVVLSTNAPAPFTGMVLSGGAQFSTLIDSSGTTNDSIPIMIDPSLTAGPGFYYDSVSFSVDGITNPALLVISLQITADTTGDTTGGGGQDSAWVMPSSIFAHAFPGSTDKQFYSPILLSTNAPAAYSGFVVGGPTSFVQIPDSAGLTNDSVLIQIDPSGLDVGWYVDTVVFDVSGISRSVRLAVTLQVNTSDSSITNTSNFPNPFNPTTTIVFSLPRASDVKLTIYNVLGQEVTTLIDEVMASGNHSASWDATDARGRSVSSGVYFYRLQTPTSSTVKKMLLMK